MAKLNGIQLIQPIKIEKMLQLFCEFCSHSRSEEDGGNNQRKSTKKTLAKSFQIVCGFVQFLLIAREAIQSCRSNKKKIID